MESGAEQCAPLVLGHSARRLVARRSLDLEKMTVHWKDGNFQYDERRFTLRLKELLGAADESNHQNRICEQFAPS